MIYAVIADDLTGAGDTGVQFAKVGLVTRVLFGEWGVQDVKDSDILVLNTDSRFLKPKDAAEVVTSVTQALRNVGVVPFFKKVDSTLRGPIGAEIDALMDAQGLSYAVVCPAFPANGRSLVGGYLLVDGQPVSRGAAGKDPVTPVKMSHVPTLISQQSTKPVYSCTMDDLSPEGLTLILSKAKAHGAIVVCDAVSNADLDLIAECAMVDLEGLLLVGAAGLANPVAKIMAARAGKGTRKEENRKPVIVAVGSVNPVSREQSKYLVTSGAAEIVLLKSVPLLGRDVEPYLVDAVEKCLAISRRGSVPVVVSAGEQKDVEEALALGSKLGIKPTEVASRIAYSLAKVVRSFVAETPSASVVATGGDVARAVMEQFRCSALDLVGEVSPGIPVCLMKGGQIPGTRLITKAGGFGKPDALKSAVDILST